MWRRFSIGIHPLALSVAIAASFLLLASTAYAAPFYGPAPNGGNFCIDNGDGVCAGLGYNMQIECPDWCDYCYDGDGVGGCDPDPPPAAVPEMEDYAAGIFLLLALVIGWKVRRRQNLA